MSLNMTAKEYLQALIRQRHLIQSGEVTFFAVDDDTIGNKHTEASYGVCSEDPNLWPAAKMHLWPQDFIKYKRIAPKYRKVGQPCPFDLRAYDPGYVLKSRHALAEHNPTGCFYHCMIFGRKITKAKAMEQAVSMYDNLIAVLKPED